MSDGAVTVVLPCLNEAESLPAVLAAIPDGYQVLVVDNNSTDDTVEVALRHGARVVTEPRPAMARRCTPGGGGHDADRRRDRRRRFAGSG
ncbi:glycosyl transferase 2 family protein [Mycobacterium xenopi 3993]|nr:glycosyl transferase 2 family protein [Mycobacterium xenopi 3993]